MIDVDADRFPVSVLKDWQKQAELRVKDEVINGPRFDVRASPSDICKAAQNFLADIESIKLPQVVFTYQPFVRAETLWRAEDFIRRVAYFTPAHPLHGLHDALVALQQLIINHLREFVRMVRDQHLFYYDGDERVYRVVGQHYDVASLDRTKAMESLLRTIFSLTGELWPWIAGERFRLS